MCQPAGVPQLSKHERALAMYGLGDACPSRHLIVSPQPRRSVSAVSQWGNGRAFGDDQPAVRGALGVVLKLSVAGRIAGMLRSLTCQRRHNDAVFQCDWPDPHGAEEQIVSFSLPC